jgi:hypothetical protein
VESPKSALPSTKKGILEFKIIVPVNVDVLKGTNFLLIDNLKLVKYHKPSLIHGGHMKSLVDILFEFFYTRPSRIVSLGSGTFSLGSGLIIAGLIGAVGTTAINRLPTLAHSPVDTKTLAEIYPDLPTWWIPESSIGFFLSFVLAMIGVVVALHGKQVSKHF